MSELAKHSLAGLFLLLVAGSSVAVVLLESLNRHSTLARLLLLFSCLASVVFLVVSWRPGMQPFRYPLMGLVLASSSAAFFTVFWSSATRGPRLHAAVMVLFGTVAFALAPTVSWPWRQAQSAWFLWSEVLYTVSAGALWAGAARAGIGAVDTPGSSDPASVNTVAVALAAQTFALLLMGVGAHVAWGSYWAWDPIESWRLAAWLATVALAIVLGQLGWRWRRAHLVQYLVAAFAAAVLWGSFPLVHWLGLLSTYLPS